MWWFEWWQNASRMLLETWGVPTDTPTLKSVEIRERGFREEDRFHLGDC